MASIEVMKERARIAGRFNLSARRNPEHRALVALAAHMTGGECQVVPVAPGEDEAEMLRRARKVAGGKPVIIVTEADGELHAHLMGSDDMISIY
ncbi:aminotransferase [Rothia mucilaginosa]|uniref:aminotransferase n=1 Tax=Rothia mucilaginosa TaxID=43675 RepID=UPI0026F0F271|nr:aminotransferase [Rothia mucilaginosa]